jgi:hypothetical protein
MTMKRLWAMPLALVGVMAIGAAVALRRSSKHRHAKERHHNEGLQAWEGEGGSQAVPAMPHTKTASSSSS